MVTVYARYRVGEPGDKFWGSGSLKVLSQSYARMIHPDFGRRYWGWRGYTTSRRELARMAPEIASDILETYRGARPIHAVSVRPAHLE